MPGKPSHVMVATSIVDTWVCCEQCWFSLALFERASQCRPSVAQRQAVHTLHIGMLWSMSAIESHRCTPCLDSWHRVKRLGIGCWGQQPL